MRDIIPSVMKKGTDALIVMVKAPVAGLVKTRLVPPLTPKEASDIYRCFILDTINTMKGLEGVDLYVAYTPEDKRSEVSELLPMGIPIIPQNGADLGERLERLFRDFLSGGHTNVCIIGSDSPDLPAGYVEEAFSMLKEDGRRVVLGPAGDGGYYLIAMNFFSPIPFRDMRWSTSSVLEDTLERLRSNGISTVLLGPWDDVDTPGDLKSLFMRNGAPLSRTFIEERGILDRIKG